MKYCACFNIVPTEAPCHKITGKEEIEQKVTESQLAVAMNVNKLLMKKLVEVEKTSNGNARYAIKESIEFQGSTQILMRVKWKKL